MKLADTLVFPLIVKVQLPMPLHPPPQPARPQAPSGMAVKVTCVPELKLWLQLDPQSIPEGELVTLPPELATSESDRV